MLCTSADRQERCESLPCRKCPAQLQEHPYKTQRSRYACSPYRGDQERLAQLRLLALHDLFLAPPHRNPSIAYWGKHQAARAGDSKQFWLVYGLFRSDHMSPETSVPMSQAQQQSFVRVPQRSSNLTLGRLVRTRVVRHVRLGVHATIPQFQQSQALRMR